MIVDAEDTAVTMSVPAITKAMVTKRVPTIIQIGCILNENIVEDPRASFSPQSYPEGSLCGWSYYNICCWSFISFSFTQALSGILSSKTLRFHHTDKKFYIGIRN